MITDVALRTVVVPKAHDHKPVLSDCAYGPGLPTVHMGDMVIESSMTLFGTPMDITMYVTMEAGFELGFGEGLITFGLTDMKTLEIQTEIQQEDLVSSEALLTAMVEDTMVPALLAGFGGDEAGFPVPEIDFGNGATFGVNASTIVRVPGHTLISGGVQ